MRRTEKQQQTQRQIEDAEDEIRLEDELVGVFGEEARELDCAEHQKQDAEQHSKNGVEGVGKERQPHASQDQQRGEEEIAGFCDFQQRTHRNCLQSDRIIIVATV